MKRLTAVVLALLLTLGALPAAGFSAGAEQATAAEGWPEAIDPAEADGSAPAAIDAFADGGAAAPTIEAAEDPVFAGNEWNTNQVFAINREDPHANFIAYSNEADALENHTLYKEKSDYYQSLDGVWKFHWAYCPAERASETATPGFTALAYDDGDWDTMEVPKDWQATFKEDGTFKYDPFIYQTSGTPWGGTWNHPVTGARLAANSATSPAAPQNYNPVGTYRRTFTIPKGWKDEGRSVFVHFAGVQSNCYVWVNGRAVGYAEDSFTAKEFDITDYVDYDGENVMVVQVFRWSSATWFELQDMNRLSGIFRSVNLVARAKVDIYDINVLTTPVVEDVYDGDWNLNIKALLRDLGATQAMKDGARLEAKLLDASGAVVGQAASDAAPEFTARQNFIGNGFVGADIEFNLRIAKPKLWSAETPYLYKLAVSLKDGDALSEVTCIRVGFRQVKVVNFGTADVRYLLNGSRIVFHGVNAHENNPETGFSTNLDLVRKDISLMKLNNINALRLSHYPHHTYYYDLADEYGIYVIDEANVESHGASPFNNATNGNIWGPVLRDRMNNMMCRTYNYPSVVIWSTGNENNSIYSGGQALYWSYTTDFVKAKDPSRTVHSQYNQNGSTSTATTGPDWYSVMYAGATSWQSTVNAARRPTIQCEYAHSFGNTLGNFDEYMVTFETPRTSGGFIWDWVDQSLWYAEPGNPSERFLSHGSDWDGPWGTPVTAGASHANGLIRADRVEKTQMPQVKYGYRMLKVTDLNMAAGTYTVSNKFSFVNANTFDMQWELKENGKAIQSGSDVLDIDPAPSGVANTVMTSKTYALPFTRPDVKTGAEYLFCVSFKLRDATPWAAAGYEIATNEFVVDFGQGMNAPEAMPAGGLAVEETDESVDIVGTDTDFALSIDKSDGTISSYRFKGRDLLVDGPAPNFWRAPIDNEGNWYFPRNNALPSANTNTTYVVNRNWRLTGSTRTTDSENIKVARNRLFTQVTVPGALTDKTGTYETVYTIYPNGEVNVAYTYAFGNQATNHNYAPEIGSMMTVKSDFENMTWYGPGGETYVDRKTGYPLGVHEKTVSDNLFEYNRCQESGYHVDNRWFALTDDDGFGLLFKGSGTVPTPPNANTMVDTPFIQFNALHYRPEDMNPTYNYHPYELRKDKRDDITLRVAITSTGVGGDQFWGAYPMTQYRVNVNNKTYQYNYSILPVEKLSVDEAMDFAQSSMSAAANLEWLVNACRTEWPDQIGFYAEDLVNAEAALADPGSSQNDLAAAYDNLYDKYIRSIRSVGVSASGMTSYDGKAEYAFTAKQVDSINLVELTFVADGSMLDVGSAVFEGLEGFSVFSPGGGNLQWQDLGGGKWQSTVILGTFSGVTKSGTFDVGKLALDALKLGDAKLTLESAVVCGIDVVDGVAQSYRRLAIIDPGTATTKIFSIYDINDDDLVDYADLSLAFFYYQSRQGDEGWDAAKVADVNGDGVVDMLDLVEIYANFIG